MEVWTLEPNQERRFQVGDEPVKLELRRGLAEIYGAEMLVNKPYTLPANSKAAVFTYQGATIEVTGSLQKTHHCKKSDYMITYLTIHGELERMREDAERYSDQIKFNEPPSGESQPSDPQQAASTSQPSGSDQNQIHPPSLKPDLSKTPICLVCKPIYSMHGVGKSTLCRILLNYAARRGRAPIFVDLDPERNHISIPGNIGALSIESPIDIETGLSLRSSMLMHFGHASLADDGETKRGLLYKVLVDNMAKIVHSKLEQDKKSYYSGVIINTSGWSDDSEYKLLVHACKAFKANIVLVMDDEVLQDDLKKDLAGCDYPLNVFNLPKPPNIVTKQSESTIGQRYLRIKEYFYGTPSEVYNPITTECKFSYIKRLIYHLGNPLMLPASLMPIGSKLQEHQVKVSQYECKAADLLHHILAISFCRLDEVLEDPEIVTRTNIMGFICITSVRNDGDIVSILTPQKLPNPFDNVLLYSDIQYMDSLI